MLELRHLRTLAALGDTPSLAAAAERVHLTPSALSHQLRALESHFEAPLLDRLPRGVQLTAAGTRLVALARTVLGAIDEAEREVRALRDDAGGTLRLALECHTCYEWLMPVLKSFRRQWPAVEVDLVAGFHTDPYGLVRKHKADVAIGAAPQPRGGLVAVPLFQYEVLLIVAPEHALARRRVVHAADLAGQTLITYPVPEARIDLIRRVLQPAGLKLPRRHAELTLALVQLVASGLGVAALPSWGVQSYVAHDDVHACRIGARGLWSELCASTTPERAARPWFKAFVAIVQQHARASLTGVKLPA